MTDKIKKKYKTYEEFMIESFESYYELLKKVPNLQEKKADFKLWLMKMAKKWLAHKHERRNLDDIAKWADKGALFLLNSKHVEKVGVLLS